MCSWIHISINIECLFFSLGHAHPSTMYVKTGSELLLLSGKQTKVMVVKVIMTNKIPIPVVWARRLLDASHKFTDMRLELSK